MTHEEAINEIKSWDFLNEKEIEVIQTLIPELRESNDEKVMKILSDVFADSGDRFISEYERKQVVSWLEKQKEQKHPNGCFTCDEYKKGYEEGRRNGFTAGYNKAMKEVEQKEQKPNYCHHEVDETGWTEEYRKAYYDGWNNCNMQHEQLKSDQKPAEWSDDDEQYLLICKNALSKYQRSDQWDANIISNWLDEKLKSLRPQP